MATTTQTSPPIALSIAGSDCSGGAGIQADLKAFQQFNVYGLSAVTCIVAETPHEVRAIENIPVSVLQQQINILLETYPVAAIKIGLLPTRSAVIAVAEILKELNIPIIIDPVMIASTGDNLAEKNTATSYIERLLPLATLITPNIPEASFISEKVITDENDILTVAKELSDRFSTSCLIKGGHLSQKTELVDTLWHQGQSHTFSHPTITLPHRDKGLHGTGCTLSSAITAEISQGHPMPQAVEQGINYVQKIISNSHTWQHNKLTTQSLGTIF